jgi:NAD(P)-dependent dehydrogenase (short-subunit alcohol dehydrogenase family)
MRWPGTKRGAAAPAGAIVVTGASSGIGYVTAVRLDALGLPVFAGVRRSDAAEALRDAASDRLTPISIDVTDADSIAEAAASVRAAAHDGIAGLVNNAGQNIPGPVEFQPIEDIRRQIDVNLIGQIAVTQAFLPQIRAARGRIVNISSSGGRVTSPFLGAYNASKYGLEAVSDALRIELRPWGIWVALIEPGAVRSEIWRKGRQLSTNLAEKAPPEAHELYGEAMEAGFAAAERLERMAIAPERVARLIEHALTARRPKARYVVGKDTRALMLVDKLPERLADAAKLRLGGMPSRS